MNEHGGNIYRFAEELDMPESKVIEVCASINPIGVSPRVIAEIKSSIKYLCNYPDPDARHLRQEISRHHSVDPQSIICGNGSTELIYLIARALKPEKVLIPIPTFSEYERACKDSDELRVTSYELKKENNFDINPDEFISAMQGDKKSNPPLPPFTKGGRGGINQLSLSFDMAFFCNPNNPTGRLLKKEEVKKIADAAKEFKCYLVVDEAFIDFCPEDTVINEVQNNPYLITLRSMTKFYALSGLRIGYGVFPQHIVQRLKEYKEPWTVNSLAQKAAIIALKDKVYRNATSVLISEEKRHIEKGFKRLGIEFFPSDANFYLLKINNANEIYQQLRRKGIIVRDCSNFRGLDNTYIRVAVKSHKNNMRLMKELSRLLSSPDNP